MRLPRFVRIMPRNLIATDTERRMMPTQSRLMLACLKQKSALLHEVDWVFAVFLVIASLAKELNVAVLVSATKSYWHNVIKMVVFAKRQATASALSALELE